MRDEYSIGAAFAAIEDELIASMMRNMARHRAEETAEGIQWAMWQAEQLKALEKYKRENRKRYKGQFQTMNQEIEALIRKAKETGGMDQEKQILQAIRRGFKGFGTNHSPAHQALSGEFFRLNERKLEALIKATTSDMERAETAVLRMADDEYRKAIFNAQVYANTGAGTYEKAVDMATKDLLSRGLNCVVYANGARHTLSDYADMAVRTASKRAYLQGEGEKRQEWGIATVIVNKRGNPCPKCLPFCGKVLIDDVWSGGSKDGVDPETGKRYPLVSKAIAHGLYHPRCKDSHTTYFPGISTADDTWTEEELEAIGQASREDERKQYAERQVKKYNRLATYSLDEDNKKQYKQKSEEWDEKAGKRYAVSDEIKMHRDDTPVKMVDLVEKYTNDEFVVLDETSESAFAYDFDTDTVVVNPAHPQYAYLDARETMIHELAHRIDQNEFGSPMHLEFSRAIYEAGEQIVAAAEKYNKLFDEDGVFEYNSLISDILGCITDNQVRGNFSHDSQYIGIPGYTELEVFADIFQPCIKEMRKP
ncbi:phage minor capsid protein [Lachnoclostridium sp. An14]|uniref:phage minor capsid protein n=1 Tax=Lachnoclostridium sp. An14 TaxID=1965562 RepID=UPI001FA8214A|nr:phage minor capsid protein [Lachnoclostridium sp. An14]